MHSSISHVKSFALVKLRDQGNGAISAECAANQRDLEFHRLPIAARASVGQSDDAVIAERVEDGANRLDWIHNRRLRAAVAKAPPHPSAAAS